MTSNKISVFWFRRDLRLEDNHGLFRALEGNYPVLPLFIFDRNILDALTDKRDKRVNFIHDVLGRLNEQLIARGSSLFIVHDTPVEAFKKLNEQFDVKQVFTNHDYEPYATERDRLVSEFLRTRNVPFQTFKDQVIFERNEIVKADSTPYTIFTPYSKQWKEKYKNQKTISYHSDKITDNLLKTKPYPFPTIEEIGFQKNDPRIRPPQIDRKLISAYDKNRDIPSLNGTTRLSVHLRFGTISIRKLARIASELNDEWLNELIWREFFMMILFHFPYVVTKSFKAGFDHIPWRNNEKEFQAWCKGQTGYPIVDAGMRELNKTGFMHNRVRMIVASFLTKDLLVDWRWGEAYFAEKLLDYDLSSNNGNWQWAAGSGCDAAPYFRIFNPIQQTKRFDPKLVYIKKWIPEFESYHIAPIVDHDFARKRALGVYKAALEPSKHKVSAKS